MKVITQLIRHFWQRGLFSADQAQYLLDQGFARPRDLPGFVEVDDDDTWQPPPELAADVELPTDLEDVEDGLRQKGPGRGQRDAASKAITERALRQRVRREFERRESALAVVHALAQRCEPCHDWSGALGVLRAQMPARFHAECLTLINARPAALCELWRALDIQPFFGLVPRRECLGRVAQSYFALLVLDDPTHLGKYGWILQHDEMQAIGNLRVAHRRLLESLGTIYAQHPRSLQRAMGGGGDPVLFWALVLLHNARRPAAADFDPAREYGPLALPDSSVWRQAWTEAACIDQKALSPFLISCFSKRGAKQADDWTNALYCPVGWREPAPHSTPTEELE